MARKCGPPRPTSHHCRMEFDISFDNAFSIVYGYFRDISHNVCRVDHFRDQRRFVDHFVESLRQDEFAVADKIGRQHWLAGPAGDAYRGGSDRPVSLTQRGASVGGYVVCTLGSHPAAAALDCGRCAGPGSTHSACLRQTPPVGALAVAEWARRALAEHNGSRARGLHPAGGRSPRRTAGPGPLPGTRLTDHAEPPGRPCPCPSGSEARGRQGSGGAGGDALDLR